MRRVCIAGVLVVRSKARTLPQPPLRRVGGTDRDDEKCCYALEKAGVVYAADAVLHLFPCRCGFGPGFCILGEDEELLDQIIPLIV